MSKYYHKTTRIVSMLTLAAFLLTQAAPSYALRSQQARGNSAGKEIAGALIATDAVGQARAVGVDVALNWPCPAIDEKDVPAVAERMRQWILTKCVDGEKPSMTTNFCYDVYHYLYFKYIEEIRAGEDAVLTKIVNAVVWDRLIALYPEYKEAEDRFDYLRRQRSFKGGDITAEDFLLLHRWLEIGFLEVFLYIQIQRGLFAKIHGEGIGIFPGSTPVTFISFLYMRLGELDAKSEHDFLAQIRSSYDAALSHVFENGEANGSGQARAGGAEGKTVKNLPQPNTAQVLKTPVPGTESPKKYTKIYALVHPFYYLRYVSLEEWHQWFERWKKYIDDVAADDEAVFVFVSSRINAKNFEWIIQHWQDGQLDAEIKSLESFKDEYHYHYHVLCLLELKLLKYALGKLYPDRLIFINNGLINNEWLWLPYKLLKDKIDSEKTVLSLRGVESSACVKNFREHLMFVLNLPIERTKIEPREGVDGPVGLSSYGDRDNDSWPIERERQEEIMRVKRGEISYGQYFRWLFRSLREHKSRTSMHPFGFFEGGARIIPLPLVKTYLNDASHYPKYYWPFSLSEYPRSIKRSAEIGRRMDSLDLLRKKLQIFMGIAAFVKDPLSRYRPLNKKIQSPDAGFDFGLALPWDANEEEVIMYRHRLLEQIVGRKLNNGEMDEAAAEVNALADFYRPGLSVLEGRFSSDKDHNSETIDLFWEAINGKFSAGAAGVETAPSQPIATKGAIGTVHVPESAIMSCAGGAGEVADAAKILGLDVLEKYTVYGKPATLYCILWPYDKKGDVFILYSLDGSDEELFLVKPTYGDSSAEQPLSKEEVSMLYGQTHEQVTTIVRARELVAPGDSSAKLPTGALYGEPQESRQPPRFENPGTIADAAGAGTAKADGKPRSEEQERAFVAVRRLFHGYGRTNDILSGLNGAGYFLSGIKTEFIQGSDDRIALEVLKEKLGHVRDAINVDLSAAIDIRSSVIIDESMALKAAQNMSGYVQKLKELIVIFEQLENAHIASRYEEKFKEYLGKARLAFNSVFQALEAGVLIAHGQTGEEEIDVNALLKNIIPDIRINTQIESYGLTRLGAVLDVKSKIELILDLDEDLPLLKGHPNLLAGALENMIANAFEAAWEALLFKRTIDKAVIKVSAKFAPNTNEIVLKICDNGVGIEEENKTRVKGLDFTTKNLGTGLGLREAELVISDLGGKIYIESEAGQGTEITIRLPLSSAAGQALNHSPDGSGSGQASYQDVSGQTAHAGGDGAPAAGGEDNNENSISGRRKIWTKDAIISKLQNPPDSVTEPRNSTSWQKAGGFGGMIIATRREFGPWAAALKAAGLTPFPSSKKPPWQKKSEDWAAVRKILPEGRNFMDKPRLLRPEEQSALFDEVRAGNSAARSVLILAYQPLVLRIAGRLAYSNPDIGVDVDELIAEGTLGQNQGLPRAVELFDPARGVKFATYASFCIERCMLSYVKRKQKEAQRILSLDQPVDVDDDNRARHEFIRGGDREDIILQIVEKDSIEELSRLLKTIKASERDKLIFMLRVQGERQAEIGRRPEINLTRERIRQIEARMRKKVQSAYRIAAIARAGGDGIPATGGEAVTAVTNAAAQITKEVVLVITDDKQYSDDINSDKLKVKGVSIVPVLLSGDSSSYEAQIQQAINDNNPSRIYTHLRLDVFPVVDGMPLTPVANIDKQTSDPAEMFLMSV